MKGIIEIIIGLLLIVFTIWILFTYQGWWAALKDVLQGGVMLLLLLVGLAVIALGVSDLKQ